MVERKGERQAPPKEFSTPANAFNAYVEILKARSQRRIKRQSLGGEDYIRECRRLEDLTEYLRSVGYDPFRHRNLRFLQEKIISDMRRNRMPLD